MWGWKKIPLIGSSYLPLEIDNWIRVIGFISTEKLDKGIQSNCKRLRRKPVYRWYQHLLSFRANKVLINTSHLWEFLRGTMLDECDETFGHVTEICSLLSQLQYHMVSVKQRCTKKHQAECSLTSHTDTKLSDTLSMIFSLIGCVWSRCLMINSDLNTKRLNNKRHEIGSFSVLRNASGR